MAASSAACFSVITPPFRHLLTADRLTPIFFLAFLHLPECTLILLCQVVFFSFHVDW